MAAGGAVSERMALVTRRLTGVDGAATILEIFASGKTPRGFWATAPTGKPHIAYLVPLLKLADFAKAGIDVTILVCDMYAFLVNHDCSMETVGHRARYYKILIEQVLRLLGVPEGKVAFVEGSSYELDKDFIRDMYRLAVLADEAEVKNTGAEYRKATKLSVLFCPGLPALAEEYLQSDFQFGGEDQAGLFAFNERFLPQLGYRKRGHLMNPMIPGLKGSKMSASAPDSKIDFLDSPETIHQKLDNSTIEDGVIHGNGLLPLLKHIIFPFQQCTAEVEANISAHSVHIEIDLGDGECRLYRTYAEIEHDFIEQRLPSHSLKKAVAGALCTMLAQLRQRFNEDKEWQMLERLAYQDS